MDGETSGQHAFRALPKAEMGKAGIYNGTFG